MTIDPSTEFGARVQRRLQEEQIIWLVTVGADGTPQPSPVWFIWEDDSALIYSQPDTPKLRNIAARPQAALHFNSDEEGGDIIVLTGTAALDPQAPPVTEHPAYLAKYDAGITRIGMNRESFAQAYSAAFRVSVRRIRGF
jgi:PPOX class probable F420-dependent enzyme